MASQETELIREIADGRMNRRQALRLGLKGGLGLAALAGVLATAPGAGATKAKKDVIGPTCIFVCCDEKCDDFCLRCVEWPKPKPKVAVMTRQ
ncbi:MAG: hypothetical protein IT336_03765 [Thermomicrobiales bacterium]|nr:hypothetical protein [Thermomicrobiales bacterium]